MSILSVLPLMTILTSIILIDANPHPGHFSWKFSDGKFSVLCNSVIKSCLNQSSEQLPPSSSSSSSSSSTDWTYEDPSLWPSLFPSCGGNQQSPINIAQPIVPRPSTRIEFNSDYTVTINSVEIINNGKSVETILSPGSNVDPIIRYNDNEYRFVSFHFHWGPNNSVGSETTFNGQRFPLELNMIHINVIYDTTEEAFGQPDGTLILGVSFALSSQENPTLSSQENPTLSSQENPTLSSQENPTLSRLISVFPAVQVVNSTTTISNFPPLITLITFTDELSRVFDYIGSLTTPPCTENIRWLILSEQLPVSNQQMDAFRSSFLDDQGRILSLNYRPTQARNGREIFAEKISVEGL